MATSGTRVLNRTAADVVNRALRDAGIVGVEESIASVDFQTGLDYLNDLLKSWQAQGYHLWSLSDGVLFLQTDKQSYNIGPSGDECCDADDFISTEIATAATSGATTLVVDSTTGMQGLQNSLSSNPTTSTQDWTATGATLSLSGSGFLVVTNSGAASGTADYTLTTTVGAVYVIEFVYEVGTSSSATFSILDEDASDIVSRTETANGTYTLEFTATQLTHRFRVKNVSTTLGETSEVRDLQQQLTTSGDNIGIELDDGTRQWTNIQSVDSATGLTIVDALTDDVAVDKTVYTFTNLIPRPLRTFNMRSITKPGQSETPVTLISRQEYFDQTVKDSSGTVTQGYYEPRLTNGRMYVWNVSNDVKQILKFNYEDPLEINTANANDVDVPSEWFRALSWNLAEELVAAYKISDAKAAMISQKAMMTLEEVLDYDAEDGSIFIGPNND